jgi:polyisoprenoid-binding protein YceI
MRSFKFLLPLVLLTQTAIAAPVEWAFDASHSRIGFSVAHLVISEVSGQFKQATGKFLIDDADLTKSKVDLTIQATSIDTGDEKRDEHLRKPDFFDVAKFPTLQFKSTKIVKSGASYKLSGDLTIKGVTKPVTLDATLSNSVKSPWGKEVRGAKLSGKIKRADFGLTYNAALEAGGVVIGEEVMLDIQVELNK